MMSFAAAFSTVPAVSYAAPVPMYTHNVYSHDVYGHQVLTVGLMEMVAATAAPFPWAQVARQAHTPSTPSSQRSSMSPAPLMVMEEDVAEVASLDELKPAADEKKEVRHSAVVFVGQIPASHFTRRRVTSLFAACGNVTRVDMLRTRRGKASYSGFVHFDDNAALTAALGLDGSVVDGRALVVRLRDEATQ